MKKKKAAKPNTGSAWKAAILVFQLAVLGSVLLFRYLTVKTQPTGVDRNAETQMTASAPITRAEEKYTDQMPEEKPEPDMVPETTSSPAIAIGQKDAQAPRETEASKPYTEYTYGLATDMVHIWRTRQEEGSDEIFALLEELKRVEPELGKAWEGIMKTWEYVDTEMEIHYEALPEDLAKDDRLCIVVLGYQLKSDGSMTPELVRRCETAFRCAEAYPNALVAVTGGGTASQNRSATEADAMADWLISHGISRERIIIENTSLTTVQNAKKTCAILAEHYPQISQVAIVSSDYHIPLGTLLFSEAAILYEYENGILPYTVVANAAFAIENTGEHLDIRREAQDLWSLADPKY